MAYTEEQIKIDIKAFIAAHGGNYRGWYVGVSKDPEDRLFNDHGVDKEDDWWIYRRAFSSSAARRVEDYFVNTLGTDGDVGGGDKEADYVYAYKKNEHTSP